VEAHSKHGGHVRDAGGVETQRLVERRRFLSSIKREAWEKGRHAGREAWVRGRRKQRAGRSQRRTENIMENIQLMPVTLDVSRLSG
jgi:hypothetical protein